MSQEERIEARSSVEAHQNGKGDLSLNAKVYATANTPEALWDALQLQYKAIATMRVQYGIASPADREVALLFVREMNAEGIEARGVPANESDLEQQLGASIEQVKASKTAPPSSAQAVSDRLGKAIEAAQRAQENYS